MEEAGAGPTLLDLPELVIARIFELWAETVDRTCVASGVQQQRRGRRLAVHHAAHAARATAPTDAVPPLLRSQLLGPVPLRPEPVRRPGAGVPPLPRHSLLPRSGGAVEKLHPGRLAADQHSIRVRPRAYFRQRAACCALGRQVRALNPPSCDPHQPCRSYPLAPQVRRLGRLAKPAPPAAGAHGRCGSAPAHL